MARTVTVHDPATGSTFAATRTQWERLYAGTMELVTDEDGRPIVSPKATPTVSKPKPEAE